MNLERIISVGMDFDGCFLVAWILVLAAAFASPFATRQLQRMRSK
jgi:hypothetical protein